MKSLSLSEMISNNAQNNYVDPIQPLTMELETEPEEFQVSDEDVICLNFTDLQSWIANTENVCNVIEIPGSKPGTFIMQSNSDSEKVKLIRDGVDYQIIDMGSDVADIELRIFGGNGFVIEFSISPQISIKQLCSKTSFDIIVYVKISGCDIPTHILNFSRKHGDAIDVQLPIISDLSRILYTETDFDEGKITMAYPKYPSENNHSKMECIKWFTNRKKTIGDISHILKIDRLISTMFISSTNMSN